NETHKPKQPKKREQPTTTYYKYANNQLYQTLIKDTKEAPPKHNKIQKRTNHPLHNQSQQPTPTIPHPKQIQQTLRQQNPKTQPN
ncbi:MAG: hypothetical protein LBI79_10240, partial [Nitrososphaerota archaeon]|nr:hypothetical protein [Nitrososphaerota archaeon]